MADSHFLKCFETYNAICDDVRIFYATAGTGPAILLLHGHPQTHIV